MEVYKQLRQLRFVGLNWKHIGKRQKKIRAAEEYKIDVMLEIQVLNEKQSIKFKGIVRQPTLSIK
jgi:hypothetical protein